MANPDEKSPGQCSLDTASNDDPVLGKAARFGVPECGRLPRLKADMPKKMSGTTQREMRQRVIVDGGLRDVSSVTWWYRAGHFKSEEAAAGAFELAYQQGMDGMGESIGAWMGMTEAEFNEWMRNNTLPSKKSVVTPVSGVD